MTKEERQRLTEALKEDGAARELQRELTELKATIVEQKKVIRELKCEIKRLED
jgi:cell division protein FtsL